MQRILVSVDGSEHSLKAAKYAAQLAGQLHAQLTLATVFQPFEMLGPGLSESFSYAAFNDEQARQAKEILKDIAAKVHTEIPPESRVLHGSPPEAVALLAEREAFDLVVVGSRGRNLLNRMLLGSFADRLVHICQRPVLVVK